jgi:signal recognition particle receptor subunit beta
VDTRRVTDSFAPIDFFESRKLPYLVAVNCFDGAPRYAADEVREALAIAPEVPLMLCDARQRGSAKSVLITVVEHAIAMLRMELSRAGR